MRSIVVGDCVEAMAGMPPCSVDCVVTDPPYLWAFMGKEFDSQDGAHADPRLMQEWHYRWAVEALRVLRPGGYLLAFGGGRTFHRLACAVEDAGFEIRDRILVLGADGELEEVDHPTELAWVYGSGFPKSLNVSLAIDREAGAEREVVGVKHAERYPNGPGGNSFTVGGEPDGTRGPPPLTAPATDEAKRWQGFGTALKPATEPIVVARKPLRERTVARNVVKHGTGALNVDGCRVATEDGLGGGDQLAGVKAKGEGWTRPWMVDPEMKAAHAARVNENVARAEALGRWPANVVLVHAEGCRRLGTRTVRGDGNWEGSTEAVGYEGGWDTSDHPRDRRVGKAETVEDWDCVEGCPVRALDEQAGTLTSKNGGEVVRAGIGFGGQGAGGSAGPLYGDAGGPSRFFYCAKASRAERNAGLEDFEAGVEARTPMAGRGQGGLRCRACGHWKASGSPCECAEPDFEQVPFDRPATANGHPTVKALGVMRWLARLACPPGGIVLDPFAGSGTTGIAAALEGFRFIGVEEDEEYAPIAEARIRFWAEHGEEALAMVRAAELAGRGRREAEDAGQLDLFAAGS